MQSGRSWSVGPGLCLADSAGYLRRGGLTPSTGSGQAVQAGAVQADAFGNLRWGGLVVQASAFGCMG
jgi:hypothetical protein